MFTKYEMSDKPHIDKNVLIKLLKSIKL